MNLKETLLKQSKKEYSNASQALVPFVALQKARRVKLTNWIINWQKTKDRLNNVTVYNKIKTLQALENAQWLQQKFVSTKWEAFHSKADAWNELFEFDFNQTDYKTLINKARFDRFHDWFCFVIYQGFVWSRPQFWVVPPTQVLFDTNPISVWHFDIESIDNWWVNATASISQILALWKNTKVAFDEEQLLEALKKEFPDEYRKFNRANPKDAWLSKNINIVQWYTTIRENWINRRFKCWFNADQSILLWFEELKAKTEYEKETAPERPASIWFFDINDWNIVNVWDLVEWVQDAQNIFSNIILHKWQQQALGWTTVYNPRIIDDVASLRNPNLWKRFVALNNSATANTDIKNAFYELPVEPIQPDMWNMLNRLDQMADNVSWIDKNRQWIVTWEWTAREVVTAQANADTQNVLRADIVSGFYVKLFKLWKKWYQDNPAIAKKKIKMILWNTENRDFELDDEDLFDGSDIQITVWNKFLEEAKNKKLLATMMADRWMFMQSDRPKIQKSIYDRMFYRVSWFDGDEIDFAFQDPDEMRAKNIALLVSNGRKIKSIDWIDPNTLYYYLLRAPVSAERDRLLALVQLKIYQTGQKSTNQANEQMANQSAWIQMSIWANKMNSESLQPTWALWAI